MKEIEQKWWLQGDAESVKRNILAQKDQAKAKIERERYLKALKALVSEKSAKMLDAEIPDLCGCGPFKDTEATVMRKEAGEDGDLLMCANNC